MCPVSLIRETDHPHVVAGVALGVVLAALLIALGFV